jgi:hypothetical protein
MKRCPNSRILAIVATLCFSLMAFSAFAQLQTGNIYGKAQAKDGSALPGVTVTLTGNGAPQTTVTDASGNFRFPNLSPGSYTVKAELSGFGTATRAGLTVNVGQNADITMTLNASMAESITVTAESPLLDVRKAGTATNVSKIEMEKIPTSRDPWTVLQSIPAVNVDRINVGGSQSGQQSVYYAKGALGRDNTWNVDGVNITDMGATGSSPLYFDFDSFEEMQATTGGSDPRIETPGVQLNMVTKRGTNDIRGSGRYYYTPGSMQAKATVPGEATYYLENTNKVNFVRDYGVEAGGPIWKDHLWFWGARGDDKISVQASNTIAFDPKTNLPIPTVGLFDNIVLRDKNAKLNAQIVASNSAVGFYTWGDKVRNARNLSPTRPFETAWRQIGPTTVYKFEDTQIIGSSLYLTGMWSKISGGFSLNGNGGQGEGAPSRWRDAAGVNHDNFYTYVTDRPQKQERLDGSKFLDIGRMNHELKFGFGYRNTPVHSTSVYPGPAHGWWDYSGIAATCTAQGLPANCGVANLSRDVNVAYGEKYNDFYVGDTILMGNLTLQGGLRWDRQQSSNLGVSILANPILATPLNLPCSTTIASSCTGGTLNASLPGVTYGGDSRSLKWNTVSPRIGLTYSLGADKRTLLRAGYNRYSSQIGSAVSGANPLAYSAFYILGVDTNNDHVIQRNELQKINGFAGVNPANPTAIALTRRVDYGMKVPTTDEIIVGAERELMSDFSVGVNYTYRKYNNLFTTRFEKTSGAGDFYTPDDWVLSSRTAGGTFVQCAPVPGDLTKPGTITGVGAAQVCNGTEIARFNTTSGVALYQLKSGVPVPVYRVLTTRPDYSQKYSGLELTATKRMSHKWMFRGNLTYNNYTESCGATAAADPTNALPGSTVVSGGPGHCPGGQVAPQSAGSGAFGNDFISAKWNLNLTGAYIMPWDINLGASLSARQGYPQPFRSNVSGLPGGTVGVVLDPIGDIRFDNVYELDLRIAKDFRFMNRVGMTLSGDLFNAPNKRTVLQRETLIINDAAAGTTSRPAGNRITEMQSPRIWRLGAKFNF